VTLFAAHKERRQPVRPQCFSEALASCGPQMEAAKQLFGTRGVLERLRNTDLRQICRYVIL